MKTAASKLILIAAALAVAQPAAQRDWGAFGQDPGGTKHSTLNQITTENVKTLTRAWVFHTGDSTGFFESTPLIIDSVMYFSTTQAVFALDAVTGKQIWKYETTGTARRGPTYWAGGNGVAPRIFSSSADGLAALDAKTGTLVASFGVKGVIPGVRVSSPPAIYRNVLITQGGASTVKAWDTITGEPRWTLALKAQPDDPNFASWLGDSGKSTQGPGLWGIFSVDMERGLVFVPVEKVGNDYYGGPHHGNNLYSDSLMAVDALTGKIRWHQQLVHHDIWDYDVAAQPTLVEVRRDGRTIPGVAQITKMGLLFVFNRETGEPMYGMEERPVPQTTLRGEWTSATQPFPIKPPPLARNSLKKEELAKVTPELEAYCLGLWQKYNLSDSVPYQPWQEKQDIVVFPGAIGGGNWNGVMFNRPLGLIITNVMNAGQWGHMEERAPGAGRGGRGGGRGAAAGGDAGRRGGGDPNAEPPENVPVGGAPNMSKVTPEGGRFWEPTKRYSCSAPPWGELIAVNANTGDIAWRVPLGEFEELEAKGIKTGQPSLGGGITTSGNLVFIGATIDGFFRAFDARNGKELWRDKTDAPAHSIPATYMGGDGKQYVVVPAGGGGFLRSPTSDTVIAYRLK